MLFNVSNSGTALPTNLRVTGISAVSTVVATVPQNGPSISQPLGSGTSCTSSSNGVGVGVTCTPNTYIPVITLQSALPGAWATWPVTSGPFQFAVNFTWPKEATRAAITVNLAADGGYTRTSTINVFR